MAEPEHGADPDLPRDALAVKQILEGMGVTEAEPRVVNQLLDFAYRYVAEVLQDAEAYAERAGAARGEVAMEDVMLAIQARTATAFTQPPPLEVLSALAERRNARAFPEVRPRYGLRLPPREEDTLLAPVHQLGRPSQPKSPTLPKSPAGQAQAMEVDGSPTLSAKLGKPYTGFKAIRIAEIAPRPADAQPG